MEVCQLLLSAADRGISLNCVKTILFFLGEASREEAVVVHLANFQVGIGTMAGESRRYIEAARFYFGAENETEAGKAGNQIKLRIRCRLHAAVANSVYLALYHSAPIQSSPPTVFWTLPEIVEVKAQRLAIFIVRNYQIGHRLGLVGGARRRQLLALRFTLGLLGLFFLPCRSFCRLANVVRELPPMNLD